MEQGVIVENLYLGEEITEATQAVKQTVFFLASARVRGVQLVRVVYERKNETELQEKIYRALRRILNAMKKRGDSTFYLRGNELQGESTEAQYLLEKCASLANEYADIGNFALYIYL